MQSTNHILFIRPAVFYSNPETLPTNVFQARENDRAVHEITTLAIQEQQAFIDALIARGVHVTIMQGDQRCPDHIFPNCLTTHSDRRVIYYPMLAENRRLERTPELESFIARHYDIGADYARLENQGEYIESTSSIVMDRVNKIGYVALSARTSRTMAELWGREQGYKLHIFNTLPLHGLPLYHTDLMLVIGTKAAIICADAIEPEMRGLVMDQLRSTHDVMEITYVQVEHMCGNALEVLGYGNKPYIVMSSQAYEAMQGEQIDFLKHHFEDIIHAPLPTIEKYGGGSARCMMLELF